MTEKKASTLQFFTFRGRHSGRMYYGTGFNAYQAAKEINIALKDLILERSETMPTQPPMTINHMLVNEVSPKNPFMP